MAVPLLAAPEAARPAGCPRGVGSSNTTRAVRLGIPDPLKTLWLLASLTGCQGAAWGSLGQRAVDRCSPPNLTRSMGFFRACLCTIRIEKESGDTYSPPIVVSELDFSVDSVISPMHQRLRNSLKVGVK